MKKVFLTVFMAALMPMFCGSDYSVCFAEDGYPDKMNIPDIAPIYDSYYDYSEGVLYIYGSVQYTVITVEVTHNGQTILMDVLSPNNLPAQYNFNGYDYGYYHVTISAGNTLLTTFGFNLL